MRATQANERVRRHILNFGVLTIAVLVGGAMLWFRDPWSLATTFPDERTGYIPAAETIVAEGLHYFFYNIDVLRMAPLNPAWLALWGVRVPLAISANVVLAILGALIVWRLAKRVTGEGGAFLVLCCYLFYPQLWIYMPTVLTEPLFIFLVLLTLWSFILAFEQGRPFIALISGVCAGLCALVRPTVQLLTVFVAIIAIFQWLNGRTSITFRGTGRRELDVQNTLTYTALFVVGACIVLGPYVLKNWLSFQRIAVANGGGAAVYLGTDLRRHGDEPPYYNFNYDTHEHTHPSDHLSSEGDRALLSAALTRIQEHPWPIVQLTFVKLGRFLFGNSYAFFYPQRSFIHCVQSRGSLENALRLIHLLLFVGSSVFGVIGALILWRANVVCWFLTTYVAYLSFIHSITFVNHRYALGVYPAMLILSAAALSQSGRRVTRYKLVGAALVLLISMMHAFSGERLSSGVSERYRSFFALEQAHVFEQQRLPLFSERTTFSVEWNAAEADRPLVIRLTPLEARANQAIFLKIAVKSNEQRIGLRLYWAADELFELKRSVTFDVVSDGKERWYMIVPSLSPLWAGQIAYLRLDFPETSEGIRYFLRSVEVRR